MCIVIGVLITRFVRIELLKFNSSEKEEPCDYELHVSPPDSYVDDLTHQ